MATHFRSGANPTREHIGEINDVNGPARDGYESTSGDPQRHPKTSTSYKSHTNICGSFVCVCLTFPHDENCWCMLRKYFVSVCKCSVSFFEVFIVVVSFRNCFCNFPYVVISQLKQLVQLIEKGISPFISILTTYTTFVITAEFIIGYISAYGGYKSSRVGYD